MLALPLSFWQVFMMCFITKALLINSIDGIIQNLFNWLILFHFMWVVNTYLGGGEHTQTSCNFKEPDVCWASGGVHLIF